MTEGTVAHNTGRHAGLDPGVRASRRSGARNIRASCLPFFENL